MAAFYVENPIMSLLRRVSVVGPALADGVEYAAGAIAFYRPAHRLAKRLSDAGARVWTYRFDYAAPASPFGAAHCIELPFLFGTDADWTDAPMLAGADPSDIDALGRRLRGAWLGFIRAGAPTADPPWPQYTGDSPVDHHWS
jgi:para-nitrobenzyl esterase